MSENREIQGEEKKSFEERMQEMEKISKALSEDGLNLAEIVRLYEKGLKLKKELEAELEEARLIIEKAGQEQG